MAFYDLNKGERIALTERAIAEKRSVIERCEALAQTEAKPWDSRSSVAAQLLSGQIAVADLGCGVMGLEKHLSSSVTYFPVDIVSRDERTIVCDFNIYSLPCLPARAAACLGLIEYILRPEAFLIALRQKFDCVVVSYNCSLGDTATRRSHAWVNDFEQAEFEALLNNNGWNITDSMDMGGRQSIWRITR